MHESHRFEQRLQQQPRDGAGTARVETAFMGLFGINYLDIGVNVEVTRESKGLEIALVLDNTGSMAEIGKMPALKTRNERAHRHSLRRPEYAVAFEDVARSVLADRESRHDAVQQQRLDGRDRHDSSRRGSTSTTTNTRSRSGPR